MDWLDLLAVQGTFKSLLQYLSSKALILLCSAFFIVQLYNHTWRLSSTNKLKKMLGVFHFLHVCIKSQATRPVQLSSVTQSYPTLCSPMDCSMPGLPVHHQLPKPTQTHVHHVGDVIQPSHPLSSPSPPSFNLAQHQGFSNESVLHIRWPKYWSFSFSINPSNEYSGLISFRMDWLDLLAVQGALKSLLQHRNSKAPILQDSTFFIVQLSHPYMTTRKTIALTRWTFVGELMSLLFNMLSRLVIAFLPRS